VPKGAKYAKRSQKEPKGAKYAKYAKRSQKEPKGAKVPVIKILFVVRYIVNIFL
jgi:hypothetical protein